MPQRSKPRPKKKPDAVVVILPDTEEPPPLTRKPKAKTTAGRKRSAPVESEDEGTKTPKRTVRQKVATRKQNVAEKKDSALKGVQQQQQQQQQQVEEEPRVTTKKKSIRRKTKPEIPLTDELTSSPAKKPLTPVSHVKKPVRVSVKKRSGSSRAKKVVLEERVEDNDETVEPKRKTSAQKKALAKGFAIQVDAGETSKVDGNDGIPQIKIVKKVVIRKGKAKMPSNDRALQPLDNLVDEEENTGRESPVAKKKTIKKVFKKVVKKKASAKVIEQPSNIVEGPNENIPEESEPRPPVKKKRFRRKSLVSVELPMTPSRKRTMPIVREMADGTTTEQKVTKIITKRKAVQHSPPSTDLDADISCQSGNGTDDDEREHTSIRAAVSKTSVKRRTHTPDEPLSRRTLTSRAKPSSIQDFVAEPIDDALPNSIRLVKTRNRLPTADEPGMSAAARPSVHAKSNKRAEHTHEIEKEPQSDREQPVSLMLPPSSSSSILRSPIASPSHSYGKPFVFSGIPKGVHHDTVIPLPTCDTPMIQKNKDLREANRRRSSFAMRGKRASSMSGGNLIALPHPSIPSESFFRHIAAEAPEPVRMKQLLAWCARRVEIPAGRCVDHQALQIAQQVRERIITAILEGRISTSWYNRKEDDVLPEITGPKELKEHPQNVDNRRLLKDHEDTIKRLEQEEASWTATLREYNSHHAAIVDSCPVLSDETILIDVEGEGEERRIMKEVMDTALAAVDEQLGDDSMDLDDEWLDSTMEKVEIKVDQLHSTLYTAARFQGVAREYTEDLFAKLLESYSLRRGDRSENPEGGVNEGGLRNAVDPMELLRTFAATAMSPTLDNNVKTTTTTEGMDVTR